MIGELYVIARVSDSCETGVIFEPTNTLAEHEFRRDALVFPAQFRRFIVIPAVGVFFFCLNDG